MSEVKEKKGLSTKGFVGPVIIELLIFGVVAILCSIMKFIPAIENTRYGSLVISAVIVLIGFRLVFRSSFKGNLSIKDHSFDIFLPFIVILGIDIIITLLFGEPSTSRLSFNTVMLAIAAGVSEEVMNRVFPVALMLRNKLSEKNLWPIILISSAIFGVVHLANISGGASVANSCLQVLSAFCMGLLFCAIYMRSGSIILPMILHGAHDFIAFLDVSAVTADGIMTQQINAQSLFIDIFLEVAYVALTIYLMRPSKRASVVEIWKEKWSM